MNRITNLLPGLATALIVLIAYGTAGLVVSSLTGMPVLAAAFLCLVVPAVAGRLCGWIR